MVSPSFLGQQADSKLGKDISVKDGSSGSSSRSSRVNEFTNTVDKFTGSHKSKQAKATKNKNYFPPKSLLSGLLTEDTAHS